MMRRTVRSILVAAVLLTVGYRATRSRFLPSFQPSNLPSDSCRPAALPTCRQGWLELTGTVDRLLKDDREGAPHQRFVVRLPDRTTVLVAYNLDIAERITPLEVGDTVVMRGEYIPNDKGGVMHWVHRDPSGRRAGGWVRVRGREFR